MKKIIAILLMMVMLIMLVVGCVPRNDYDVLMAEYDTVCARVESAQNEIQTLQSDLAAECSKSARLESDLAGAQAKNSELTSSLEKAESELQAGSAELAASVQKSQAELEAAQDKVSELTSSLEKVENELETIKSEYEAFKSEVESLLVLSLDQHVALQSASSEARSAFSSRDFGAFRSADLTVKGILADLNDVKADRLRSLWNDAYHVEQGLLHDYLPPYTYDRWEYSWRLDFSSSIDFNKLNREIILTIRTLLAVY